MLCCLRVAAAAELCAERGHRVQRVVVVRHLPRLHHLVPSVGDQAAAEPYDVKVSRPSSARLLCNRQTDIHDWWGGGGVLPWQQVCYVLSETFTGGEDGVCCHGNRSA